MTTRRSFFGWLAGAAAAPAAARDAMANNGGFARVVMAPNFLMSGLIGDRIEIDGPVSRREHLELADAMRHWRLRNLFLNSKPHPVRAPTHYIRARANLLRGLPEHVARQKRLKQRT